MSHSHRRTAPDGRDGGAGPPRLVHSRRVRRVLVVAVVVAALAGLSGVVALWPSGDAPTAREATAQDGPGTPTGTYGATVTSVRKQACPGTSADRRPDGTVPIEASCPLARTRLTAGPDEGRSVTVPVPPQVVAGGLSDGDRVDLALYPADAASGVGKTYVWVDFARQVPLAVVVGVFVLGVALVGRWRGVAALGGLAVAYTAIVGFVIPALLAGSDPVLVTLSAATVIMTVVLYLTHGFSLKTTAALLGTLLGLGLTALLASAAVSAVHLRGLNDEDSSLLTQLTGTADLSSLVLAGVMIAGLGVLNDVTITQASGVFEVREHAPDAGFAVLFASGMRLGRDHLASTIYTVAFAYAGAALPVLVTIKLYGQGLGQVLTSSAIAEEVVRTALGGISLVVAIPFTTAVAAAAVAGAGVVRRPAGSGLGSEATPGSEAEPGAGADGVATDVNAKSGRARHAW